MPRYKLTIEYDGAPFVGWQAQDNGPSVQAAMAAALARLGPGPTGVIGAGRTDAGVHALGQVAHVDLARAWPAATLRAAINFHLRPQPICVLDCAEVAPDFHARFSASERRYLYRILNRPAPPVLDRGRVWWVPVALDAFAMAAAARLFEGRHDFAAFRSAICQARSPIKTLDAVEVERRGDEIHIAVRARSFLHNQVRILAGTLKRIGEGKATTDGVRLALASGERRHAGPTAPAAGLYLVSVGYGAPRSVHGGGQRVDEEAQAEIEADDADRRSGRHPEGGAHDEPGVGDQHGQER